MKSLRVALLALSALVVAGCAPSVVGGVWQSQSVTVPSWEASSITLEFLSGESVRVGMVQGGLSRCRGRYDRTVTVPWTVNGDGEIVVSVLNCTLDVPACDASGENPSGSVNGCAFFQAALGARYRLGSTALVALETNRTFDRR